MAAFSDQNPQSRSQNWQMKQHVHVKHDHYRHDKIQKENEQCQFCRRKKTATVGQRNALVRVNTMAARQNCKPTEKETRRDDGQRQTVSRWPSDSQSCKQQKCGYGEDRRYKGRGPEYRLSMPQSGREYGFVILNTTGCGD